MQILFQGLRSFTTEAHEGTQRTQRVLYYCDTAAIRLPSNKWKLSLAYDHIAALLSVLCVSSVYSVVSICMTYLHLLLCLCGEKARR